jgi:hypothetical protein
MLKIPDSIKVEHIKGDYKRVRLLTDFRFYSDVLSRWCCIPAGFVFDFESVPLLQGTNPEAGAIHDYLCRTDSDPVVDKSTAAKVYLEFQRYFDEMESGNWINRFWDWISRGVKTAVVWIAPGYFHKFPVKASYEEIAA